MQKEIWKYIPGYEGYQVSSLGNLKSFKRKKPILLKKQISNKGYELILLYKDKKYKPFGVHQLVAMAFLGHKPNGHNLVVDHINNIRNDNRLENLQVITHRKNITKDRKGLSSKYVGVSWHKKRCKWCAEISINGYRKFLGRFDNEYDAHLAYQEALSNG